MAITTRFKAIILAGMLAAGMPASIVAEDICTEQQITRILLNSISETAKKVTEKISLGPLFALQSRIAKDWVKENINLENQPSYAKALEILLPFALAHATQTSLENSYRNEKLHPFYNKKLARDLILKSVLSTFFVEKGTPQHNIFCILRQFSSFFNADVFIDPTNYKKHFNWAQGVSIWIGEQIAARALIPVFIKTCSLEETQAKMLAEWLVEDVFDKQITNIVKRTPELLSHSTLAKKFRRICTIIATIYKKQSPPKKPMW